MSSRRSRYGQGAEEAPMLIGALPEDLVGKILSYLGPHELSSAGASCRDLYFATHKVASELFCDAYGAQPDSSMPRAKLFHAVGRVSCMDEASIRDLLLWSCIRGYTKMISRLCKRSTRLGLHHVLETRYGPAGVTPLLLAVEHNRLAVVKLLLQLGVDVSRGSTAGLQPIHIAAKHGLLSIAKALHASDPTVCSSTTPDGRTALHYAAVGGHEKAVEWMLQEGGADVDAATHLHDDVGNETALHLATYHGHASVVSRLLKGGANPNVQLRNGRTPALLAAELGWEEPLRLLCTRCVQYPVDLTLTTDSGKSPLFCAVERGNEAMVRLLLSAGAPAGQATRRNKVALHAAAEKGALGIAKALLDHEAAQHAASLVRTKFGTVALHVASKTSHKGMRDLLIAYTLPEGQKRKVLAGLGFDMSGEEGGEESSHQSAAQALADAAANMPRHLREREREEAAAAWQGHAHHAGQTHNPLAGIFGPSIAANLGAPASAFVAALSRPGDGGGDAEGGAGGPAMGRTLAESMIAMRATREREAVESAARSAELERKHRAAATEMAEKARKRKEEKEAAESAGKAEAAVAAKEKGAREARAKAEKEAALLDSFLKRSASGEAPSARGLDFGGGSATCMSPPAHAVKPANMTLNLGPEQGSAAPVEKKKVPLSPYAEKLTNAVRKAAHVMSGAGAAKKLAIDLLGSTLALPHEGSGSAVSARTSPSASTTAASCSSRLGSEQEQGAASSRVILARPALASTGTGLGAGGATKVPPPTSTSRTSSRGSDGSTAAPSKPSKLLAAASALNRVSAAHALTARAQGSPSKDIGRLADLARTMSLTALARQNSESSVAPTSPIAPVFAPGGNIILPARSAPAPQRVAVTLKAASFGF